MPSITINFTPAHASRIQAALEESLDIENPSASDLKDYVMSDIKQLVRTSERRVAEQLLDIEDVDLT